MTLIDGGIERQITDTGAQPKKTTFTFMNDRLGTVVEDGGDAAGANVTGFFRLTDTGVEVRYADGRGEMLTATPDGGVLMQRSAASGQASCRSLVSRWAQLQRSRQEAGPGRICQPAGAWTRALRRDASRRRGHRRCCSLPIPGRKNHPARIKPVSLTAPSRLSAPAKLDTLLPVTVKDSAVHTIDAATPPVVMTRLPSPLVTLPAGQRDASTCLKVESDGSHWGFRNACGFSVQFSYCMWRGSEPLAACGGWHGAHAISGSVAANGLATLTTDTSFSEKDGDHDFRWVACDGGAGEVVAHLERADPPSGRCERATVAVNRH